MNEDNIRKIRQLISLVNELQAYIKLNHVGIRFMHFSVEVDISKPILISFFYYSQKTKSGGRWMQFTYEKMANICYKCG